MERMVKLEEKPNFDQDLQRMQSFVLDANRCGNEWLRKLKRVVQERELFYNDSKSLGTAF